MSQTVFGAQAVVTVLNRAFNNASPANAVFNNQVAQVGTTASSEIAFANQFGASFAGTSNADLSVQVLGNLGLLPNPDLTQALADYFGSVDLASRGLVVLQLGQILSGLETAPAPQDIFNDAAKAWNMEVEKSFVYSSSTSSTTSYNGDFPVTPDNVGQTFTLTNSIDTVAGTGGDDTIIAGTQAGLATLTAGDQINGGAGTDTIVMYGNAAGAAFNGAAITNVEVVNAQLTNAGAAALDVSANAGVTQAWLVGGTTGANEVILTKAQTAGLRGAVGTTETFTFKNATTAAGDSATLAVDGATATAGVSIANIETLAVSAAGVNKLGTLTDAALETMTVTGAGAVTAIVSSAALKTVDASAATGKMNLELSASAGQVQTITTGSGDDVVTTTYLGLTSADKINLGTGTDSLRFSTAATFNDAASMGKLAHVTGVEQLGTVSALLTVNGDFATQTSYYTDGAGGDMALTNIANNADVNFGVGVNLGSAVGMKLGANTLNVNLLGGATASDLTNGLVLTGSATVHVMSAGVNGVADNVLALTAADNQSVVVTGSQNLTLTATAATGTTGFSIDGSAFTGKLTVTGTNAVDLIVGGSGNDVIAGGLGGDTLTGGAGADKFVISSGVTAATADIVTDFVSGTDTLTIGTATTAPTLTKAVAVVADFATALAAANVALGITGTATAPTANAQQVGADTWVFFSDNAAANAEHIVKLVGVDLAHVVAADFVIA